MSDSTASRSARRSPRRLRPALPAARAAMSLMSAVNRSTDFRMMSISAGLIALAISLPFVRLKGIALPMATFALLVIVYVVALNWTAVTGGRQALVGLPRYTNLWVALAAASAALLVATAYGVTRHGLALRCSRESEVAAAALPRSRHLARGQSS